MINFRYNIIKKLGQGGTSEVFLVEDIFTKTNVAMKVFLSSAEHTQNDELIQNEFSTLIGLSHKHLIRVFHCGKIRQTEQQRLLGRLFYTMEYLQGKDALNYVSSIGNNIKKIEILEDVFLQMLSVLRYIHQESLLHYDIKPQNLFILDENERPKIKLTDFGFSMKQVESVDFPFRGTPHYIAPEIIQGLAIDHRIDLYSLGVTFYHLWEGRCPFEAADVVSLFKMVVSDDIPPMTLIPGNFSFLPNMIQSLCKKNPQERFGSTYDVIMSFSSSEHEERAKKLLFSEPHLKFVGRQKELQFFEEVIASSKEDSTQNSFILISGTRGIGKTSFLKELARLFLLEGFIVIKTNDGIYLESSFVQYATQLIASEIGTKSLNEQNISYTILAKSDKAKEYAEYFTKTAAILPLVFLIDNVDSLDTLSFETIRLLALNKDNGTLRIVASISDDSPQYSTFEHLPIQRLSLNELTLSDVITVTELTLSSAFAKSGVINSIYEYYGGNPYVVREIVKCIGAAFPLAMLNNLQIIQKMEDTVIEYLSNNLEEFFILRYQKLRKEKRLLLNFLSCFDYPPTVEVIKTLTPFSHERLERYLSSLIREGYILSIENDDAVRYSIRHLKLKQSIYKEALNEIENIHSIIASGMKSRLMQNDWHEEQELARHFELGRDNETASQLYISAGDNASSIELFLDAISLYKKALECTPSDNKELRLRLLPKLANATFAQGSYNESVEVNQQMLSLLKEKDKRRTTIHTQMGKALSRLGESAKALHHFDQALHDVISDEQRAEIQQEMVALKIDEGKYDEAIQLSHSQESLANKLQKNKLLAQVETDLGIAYFLKGQFQESLTPFSKSLAIYEELQNKAKTIDALNNIGNVLSAMRNFREALTMWQKALTISAEHESPNQQAQLLNNIGIAHYHLREYDEAKSCYEKALLIFQELNSKTGITLTKYNLGEVAYDEGEYENSILWLSQSLEVCHEIQDSFGIAQSLLQSAQTYMTIGDTKSAFEKLAGAEAVIRDNNLSLFEAFLHFLRGDCYRTENKCEQAIGEYRFAEELFQTKGTFTGGYQSVDDKRLLARLYQALLFCEMYKREETTKLLQGVSPKMDLNTTPLVKAEGQYILGKISQQFPALLSEKTISLFQRGLSFIENEPVSEMSWKLSYELAQEYIRRGHRDKARVHFANVKLILKYFISKFKSKKLKEQYLHAENRKDILQEIEQY